MLSISFSLKGETRHEHRAFDRQVLYHGVAALLEGQIAVSERRTGPAGLVAEAGGDLPCQIRAAGTSVEIIRDEQPGIAKSDAATKAADTVPDGGGAGYIADAPERRAVAARPGRVQGPGYNLH